MSKDPAKTVPAKIIGAKVPQRPLPLHAVHQRTLPQPSVLPRPSVSVHQQVLPATTVPAQISPILERENSARDEKYSRDHKGQNTELGDKSLSKFMKISHHPPARMEVPAGFERFREWDKIIWPIRDDVTSGLSSIKCSFFFNLSV